MSQTLGLSTYFGPIILHSSLLYFQQVVAKGHYCFLYGVLLKHTSHIGLIVITLELFVFTSLKPEVLIHATLL